MHSQKMYRSSYIVGRLRWPDFLKKNRFKCALYWLASLLVIAAPVATAVAQSCVAPPSGIVGWWPGNGNAQDIAGENNGTTTNGVTYVTGKVGQAFGLNADSAMVVIGNPSGLQLQNFTIEMWIQRGSTVNASSDPTALSGNALLFGYGQEGYAFAINPSGTLLLSQVGYSSITSSAGVTDTAWHHVAVTSSNNIVVFYIDGVAYSAGSYNVTYQFTTSAAIGGRADDINTNNNDSFLGNIDEVSVYNQALSASQITAIYNAGASGKCDNELPPVMVQQPQSFVGSLGEGAAFYAIVNGAAPLAYHWQFGGTNLTVAATNPVLMLTNLTLAQAGNYTLVVTNLYGTATSTPAALSVLYPLSLGTVVTNGIPFAGGGDLLTATQVDTYVFTAPANRIVDMVSLGWPSGGALWSLYGPGGQTVFAGHSMPNNDVGRLQLPTSGTYQLSISSFNGNTGSYSFEVSAVQDQQFNYTLGTVVTNGSPLAGEGNLTVPGEEDTYVFTAPTNLAVNVVALSWPAGAALWSLYGPDNQVVFSGHYLPNNDIGHLQLPVQGTYRLVIYGYTDTTTGPYSFEIFAVQNPQFSYTLGTVVTNGSPAGEGNLSVPGEEDTYVFAAPTNLLVNLVAFSWPASSAYWSLYGPNNQPVFVNYYMPNNNIGRLQLPLQGTYRLVISGYQNTTVGPYSFEVNAVQDKQFSYTLGTIVTNGVPQAGEGNLTEPGEYDTYVFNAPTNLAVDAIALGWPASGAYWSLYGPDGRQVFVDYYMQNNNVGRVQLPTQGTYRLVISGYQNPTVGAYSFVVSAATNKVFAISVGQTVSSNNPVNGAGVLQSPGEYDLYTFSGIGGDIISFVDDNASGTAFCEVLAPDESSLLSGDLVGSGAYNITLPVTGTYSVLVSGGNATPISYSFAILSDGTNSSYTAPNTQIFPIPVGTVVTNGVPSAGAGNLETAGAEDVYTFTATNGQTVVLQDLGSAGNAFYYRVYDPYGNRLVFNQLVGYDNWEQTLGAAGTYTIVVNANGGSQTGTYSFALLGVNQTTNTFNITLGTVVTNGVPGPGAGNIEVPDSQDIYNFTVTNGQTVFLRDLGSTNNAFYYSVYDPYGNRLTLSQLVGYADWEQTLGAGGTYTIIVDANGGAQTGAYSFGLYGVNLATNTFNLSYGTVVTNGVPGPGAGNLETPGAEDIYTFTVTNGQTVLLQDLGSTNNAFYYSIYDPYGNRLAINQLVGYANWEQTLGAAGTYTIIVNANGGAQTGAYSFGLFSVNLVNNTFNLPLGTVVTNGVPGPGAGNLETPGAEDIYTFTATNGQTVYFQDLGSPNNAFYYNVYDPFGNRLIFDNLAGYNNWQETLATAGTYTIIVSDNAGALTGTYSFALKAVNVAPITTSVPPQYVNELTLFNLADIFSEPGNSTTVTYSLLNAPSGMSVSTNGVISWTPAQTQSPATNDIMVVATSTGSNNIVNPVLSTTNSFVIVVKEVNVAATQPAIGTTNVNELTLLTVTDTASEFNIHSTTTGYTLVSPPSGMSISGSGIITWTPTQTQSPATNTITTIVTNSNPYDLLNPQLTSTNSFIVVVKEVNVAPTLSVVPATNVNELTLLTVTNAATETNIHSVTTGYALINPPAGMSISASGVITWTPAQTESPSTNSITTVVTNSNPYDLVNPKLKATNIFTVIVKEVNVAPVLPTIGTQLAYVSHLFAATNTATDSNIHATLGYQLSSPPSPPTGMSVNSSGIIAWTPASNQAPSTNLITTIATATDVYDTVHPTLTATNTFMVIARPLVTISNSAALGGGQFKFIFNTANGANYTIEYSTNLVTWVQLVEFGGTGANYTNTDASATNRMRFYRVLEQ